MRCVSKSFHGLLSQSSFIQSHLHRSIHTNEKILLVFNDNERSRLPSEPYKVTAHRSQSPNPELTNFIKFPVKTESHLTGTAGGRVIGSVHGLICYFYKSDHDLVVYIWNPSLSALLTLPPCSICSHGNSMSTYFGFGFDPKADDYRVVKLAKVDKQEWLQVEVYSMSVMSRAGDDECEIWVMDEYGASESWVKHHVFSLDTGYIFPYGFTSHGEFLFRAVEVWEDDDDGDFDNEGYLALCYPIVAEPKTFRHIYSDPHRSFKIVEYVDSLAWVVGILSHCLDFVPWYALLLRKRKRK